MSLALCINYYKQKKKKKNRSDRCRALMLTCRNSPLWQRCGNVLSSFWPPWLDQLNSMVYVWMCVNWNKPRVSRLQLYEQPSALNNAWVRAGGCKRSLPRYPKVRVKPATRSAVGTWTTVTILSCNHYTCSITELCLTSNVKGQTVSSYENHQLGFWKKRKHPVTISVSC